MACSLAVAAGAIAYLRTRPSASAASPDRCRAPGAASSERDALQKRLTEVIVANGEKSVAKAPRGGVMIGIPTSFTRSILEQVVTGLFSEMTLTLKNLKVHKEGQVRVKLVLAQADGRQIRARREDPSGAGGPAARQAGRGRSAGTA